MQGKDKRRKKIVKDFSFKSVCLQIKLIWVGIALLGFVCINHQVNLGSIP